MSTVARPLPANGRAWLLDVFKAAGCVLIVVHHLAFYGPMSDVLMQVWPGLIEWLYDRARLAVQMFLVCGGFLTAASLAKLDHLSVRSAAALLWRRYLRLSLPLLAALSVTVLVSEIIRPGFQHDSLSALPSWHQALAHVGLAQHVLELEALSAGVWYVAIDFQLYALALLLVAVSSKLGAVYSGLSSDGWQRCLWTVLAAASLWWWSGQDSLDNYAVFFCGAYGLGWLAHHLRVQGFSAKAWAVLLLLGLVALALDPRWRLVTCWLVAALLAGAPVSWFEPRHIPASLQRSVQYLSRISYSVFVIHFGVSLLVNAGVTRHWPGQIWPNGLGMLASLGLSIGAGAVLFHFVEQPKPNVQRWAMWVLIFMTSVALAMRINNLAA
jgi:peptidoglycan/LPS O-acetylase OafA/YrhL